MTTVTKYEFDDFKRIVTIFTDDGDTFDYQGFEWDITTEEEWDKVKLTFEDTDLKMVL